MDTTTHHTMEDLFAQLGLPDDDAAIRDFVRRHRPIPMGIRLFDAPIWSDSQAGFLREKMAEDGDWAVLVDRLNVMLREHPDPTGLPQAEPGDQVEGEGNVEAARRYNAATQAHVATHDVAAEARAARPADAHEARDLAEAERAAASHARR